MKNTGLIEFSHQFEQAVSLVERIPWLSLRLKKINQIYSFLQDSLEASQQIPFRLELIECAQVFLIEISEKPWSGTGLDPKDLEAFHVNVSPGLDQTALRQLEFLVIESLFVMGDHRGLQKYLAEALWYVDDMDNLEEGTFRDLQSFQQEFLYKYKNKIPQALLNRLQPYIDAPSHESSHSQIQAMFVVAEGELQSGILAELTLGNLRAYKKPGSDQLRIATHLVDENDILADQGAELFTWLKYKYPEKIPGHLRLEYTLRAKSSVLTGSSLGLGLAVLSDMGLYSLYKNRSFEPRVYNDVAVTGAMDGTGRILPVNESTLKYKIEAAFFSQIRTVVLPLAHKTLAVKILSDLQVEFPLRKIHMVFLSSIEEFEGHREVFFYQRRKASRRVMQFFREYVSYVTLSIMSLILVLVVGLWFGVIHNPLPHKLVLDENRVRVQNKWGTELWMGNIGSTHGIIEDIDGNKTPEVIIGHDMGYESESSSEFVGSIACYDYKGNLQWKFGAGDSLLFGENVINDPFNGVVALVEDLNQDGLCEIVTIGVSKLFPCQICFLDHQGNLLSEYWHVGQLAGARSIEAFDNGKKREVAFYGINNRYRTGVILVLDPFQTHGQSLEMKSLRIPRPEVDGNEIFYVKFPNTHFFEGIRYDFSRIVSHSDGRSFTASNNKGITLPDGTSHIASVYYEFNSNMTLIRSYPTDGYYDLYKRKYPDRPQIGYGNAIVGKQLSSIEYWDGTKWVPNRTINSNYLASILAK